MYVSLVYVALSFLRIILIIRLKSHVKTCFISIKRHVILKSVILKVSADVASLMCSLSLHKNEFLPHVVTFSPL